jgi:hypothetical protein
VRNDGKGAPAAGFESVSHGCVQGLGLGTTVPRTGRVGQGQQI